MKKPPPPDAPEGPRRLTRRELTKVGVTSAVALGTVGAGLWLSQRTAGSQRLQPLRDHRVERPKDAVAFAIARGPDPAQNVRRALEALGGMSAFVKKGERVLLKPNVGWNRLPEQAANTNPEVVEEVVRHVLAAGASKVWVSDVPVNNPDRCFDRSGVRKAVGLGGGSLVLPDGNAFREVSVEGKLLKRAQVLWPLVEADRVINLPVVKQHGLSRATLAMKNWYGVLGGHRVRLHQDIHRSIVDLATMVKPTLTVLDATRLLMANGPTGGSLADVKRADTIAISADEVALDAFGASLLGLSPDDVGFVLEAEKAGLGTRRWRDLKHVEIPA